MGLKAGLVAAAVALALLGFALAGAVAHGTTRTATTTSTLATAIATTAPEITFTTTMTAPQPILPDPTITPGVLNRAVRQATIRHTICKSGWTKTIRPPVSYTNALKAHQMAQYEETGSPSSYEEDHFIPLELGGAPRDPHNLWPEPRDQSRVSDPLETSLKRKVCNGAMKLTEARAAIRTFKFANG